MFITQKLHRHGFTLIELLVSLTIITVLLSLSLVAINSARVRSRDAKRIADLRTIQAALEQHLLGDASHAYPPDPSVTNTNNYCAKYGGTQKGIYDNKCFGDYLSIVPKNTNDQQYQYAAPVPPNYDPICFSINPNALDRSGITLATSGTTCVATSRSYGIHVALESDKNQDAAQDATPIYPNSYDLIP